MVTVTSLQSMASTRTSSFLNVHFAHQNCCISRGTCKTKVRETFEEYLFFPFLEQNRYKRRSVPALVSSTYTVTQ